MKNLIVTKNITIKEALNALEKGGQKSLVIVADNGKLIGTLSDGDLRRAILKGLKLNNCIENIYNQAPTYFVKNQYDKRIAKDTFLKENFDIIPIVDEHNKLIEIISWYDIFNKNELKNIPRLEVPVVIMAGGKGTRLEPFTKVLPKPLIPINDKTIIEKIIENFTTIGANNFYLTVNYKSGILKAFFKEKKPKYKIHFIEEKIPLGTSGSLRYLQGKFEKPFFITNCDIIINVDYLDLYKFHQEGSYDITLVASAKEYVIPYGTCELNDKGYLEKINEKPEYNFLVNTGLYVMNPDVLQYIPKDIIYHITDLIEDLKKKDKKVGVYPVSEDAWTDVGQWEEYRKIINQIS